MQPELKQLERECVQADLDAVVAGEPLGKRVRSIIRATLEWKAARDKAAGSTVPLTFTKGSSDPSPKVRDDGKDKHKKRKKA